MSSSKQIVVGIDGSDGAARALRWAVAEGELRGADVLVVVAWQALDQHHADGSNDVEAHHGPDEAHQEAEAMVQAAGVDPGSVTVEARYGPPVSTLLDAAVDADLLVVGSRGRGGFTGLLLGSVSDRALQRHPGPVAVVPKGQDEGAPPQRTVLVGADGSTASIAALRWAVEEARRRGAGVTLVHGWELPYLEVQAMATSVLDAGAGEQAAEEVLRGMLSVLDAEDRALVSVRSVQGSPAEAVLQASHDADLVVLGGPPPEGARRLFVGSVARQVISHAAVPVVVVRGPAG